MDESSWVYGTASLMVGTFLVHLATKKFDPFAPIWLFFVGYLQIYVFQATSYHDWAVAARGVELVEAANFRAFWALGLFIGVYSFGPGRWLAGKLPDPPTRWSLPPVLGLCPILVVWGLICSGFLLKNADASTVASAEAALFLSFPMVMLVAGTLLIVSGRQITKPRPALTAVGIAIVVAYMVIWMFNGKRSHSLVSVLVGVCSYYVPRMKRPSFPVLAATALVGVLAVGVSIGWRYHVNSNRGFGTFGTFVDFVTTFDPGTILENTNLKEKLGKDGASVSYETEEWGGFLLMLDTVPGKANYDYGANYLRIFSTFIPRLVWLNKPVYGREQWIAAWVAGSELKRDNLFTGPAIGILGATQLNGGATGTVIVLSVVGLLLATTYHYFRLHADVTWVQACWPLWYYNAWFMTVNDDPCNWFYYNYGFTTLPTMLLLWFVNKLGEAGGKSG